MFTANYDNTGAGTASQNYMDAKQGVFVNGVGVASDGTLPGSSLTLGTTWSFMDFGCGSVAYQPGRVSDFLIYTGNTPSVATTLIKGGDKNIRRFRPND